MSGRRWLPSSFQAYLAAVVAAGLVLYAWVLTHTSLAELAGPQPWIFLVFAALQLVGEVRPLGGLQRDDGSQVTASWAFAFALVMLTPSAGPIVVLGAASAVGDLINRKRLSRLLFNAAQVGISLATGMVVLDLLGARLQLVAREPLPPHWLLAVVLAFAATYLVNGLLVCVAIALNAHEPVQRTIRQSILVGVETDGMLLALAPVFVVIAQRSMQLVPLLAATAYAVYRSARLAYARQHQATHDSLTDLPNRRLFDQRAASALLDADRRGEQLAVVQVDLDGFKEINDQLGHHTGDRVLQAVASRLRAEVRGEDLLARLGGDEFALLLRRTGGPGAAEQLAQRLREAVGEPVAVDGLPIRVGASMGIACFPEDGADVAGLLRRADLAMYAAKRQGGGVVRHTELLPGAERGRRRLFDDLSSAVLDGQLDVHYQPKVDLVTHHVVGVEALVRWRHPALGLVPPGDFMPLLEQTELILPLTEQVLSTALRQCRRWHDIGLSLSVAVNLSARNLRDRRFPKLVSRLLEEAGLDPAWLELELTENTVVADPVRATAALDELQALGVSLSLDDFGTGFSPLSSLRSLPIHSLKIDRSFVANMGEHERDAAIVRAVIDLAHTLGLQVVGEGVEDERNWQRLHSMGCDVVQGYFVSRPLPPEEMTAWLRGLTTSSRLGGQVAAFRVGAQTPDRVS